MKISLWLKHVPVKGTLNYAIDMITLLNQCIHCNKSFPETVQRFLKTCVKLKKKLLIRHWTVGHSTQNS